MSEKVPAMESRHMDFIRQQAMFFVGTAGADGFVNVSPKGMDTFRILSSQRVIWLNLTGSGNETAAHILESGRMTIMFCSFEKQPLILRLYGRARMVLPDDSQWPALIGHFSDYTGARQVFDLQLELVQTSCGYAVPFYELKGQRPTLEKWANGRGGAGIREYWQRKNTVSLDGKPTGIEPQ